MSEAAPRSLGRHVAAASLFMVGLRLSFRMIGVVSTLILVRLLAPTDFGIVGLAMAVASGLDLLTEASLGMALIRLPEMTRAHLDTAFTFQILRGLLIGLVLASTAGLAASWMGEPRVRPIMWVLSATAVIQGFENIGMVEFRRNLQFSRIFEQRFYAKLFGMSVTMPIAALFHSYWALVLGTASIRIFVVAFSYYRHPFRPWLSLARWRELFNFSKWFVLSNMMWVLDSYTATFLFGRIGGPRAVGLLQVSYQIASIPASEIAAPIREPMYSGYARVLGDVPRLRKQFVDGFAVLILVIGPISAGIALTADLITPIALGPQWADAAPLIRLCAIYAFLDAIGHYPLNLFIVLNRQRFFVLTFAVIFSIRLPLLVWAGVTWGMQAAIMVLAASGAFGAFIWMRSAMPLVALGLGELLVPVWRTLLSTGAMVVLLACFADLSAGPAPFGALVVRMALIALSGATLQIGIQAALWLLAGAPDGPETQFVRLARALLKRALATRLGAPAA